MFDGTCKLGLENPDKFGGKYKGPDVDEKIYDMLHMVKDETSSVFLSLSTLSPLLSLHYAIESVNMVHDLQGVPLTTEDSLEPSNFVYISCAGVGGEGTCSDCPHLDEECRFLDDIFSE